MDESARSGSNKPGASTPRIFPPFEQIRIQMPISANKKTIWPGPKATRWDWIKGFALELHPFAWDYLRISSDGREVQIEPHYLESTWDTFWTNGTGHVRVVALGGLFPCTLGKQAELLEGIVATLEVLPPLIKESNPEEARWIGEIHSILKTKDASRAIGPDPAASLSSLRRSTSEFVWRLKP